MLTPMCRVIRKDKKRNVFICVQFGVGLIENKMKEYRLR